MEKLILILIIFSIIIILNYYSNYKSRKKKRKRLKHIRSLDSFIISSDNFKTFGTYWRESIPVDIHYKELNPNDPFLYGRKSFGFITTRFHKQKEVNKFNTKIKVIIPYQNKKYTFKDTLNINEISLKLGFYKNKNITVYVEKIKNNGIEDIKFYFDFTFLENTVVDMVSTNYYNEFI